MHVAAAGPDGDAREGRLHPSEVAKFRMAQRNVVPHRGENLIAPPSRVRLHDGDDAARLGEWEPPQEHAIDDAIYRSGGADADGDGRDRYGSGRGAAAPGANGEVGVVEEHGVREGSES